MSSERHIFHISKDPERTLNTKKKQITVTSFGCVDVHVFVHVCNPAKLTN